MWFNGDCILDPWLGPRCPRIGSSGTYVGVSLGIRVGVSSGIPIAGSELSSVLRPLLSQSLFLDRQNKVVEGGVVRWVPDIEI